MKFRTALLAAAALVSCGDAGVSSAQFDGYCWSPNPLQPDCPSVTWIQKPPLVVPNYCGWNKIGCVLQGTCVVVSMYGEGDAHNVHISGQRLSHWEHEQRHIAMKLTHPKETPNGC